MVEILFNTMVNKSYNKLFNDHIKEGLITDWKKFEMILVILIFWYIFKYVAEFPNKFLQYN